MSRPLLPDTLVKKLQDANDRIARLENALSTPTLMGNLASRPDPKVVLPGTRYKLTETGEFFVVINGAWVLENPIGVVLPQMRVDRSTAFSIPNGAVTGITWQTGTYDLGTAAPQWDGSGAFFCRVPGLYRFSTLVGYATSSSTGQRRIAGMTLTRASNSSTTTLTQAEVASGASVTYPSVQAYTEYRMSVGDTVYVWGYQDSGVALAITGFFTASYASA